MSQIDEKAEREWIWKRGQLVYSVKEAAEYWGVPETAIRTLVKFRRLSHRALTFTPQFTRRHLRAVEPAALRVVCDALAAFGPRAQTIEHLREAAQEHQKPGFVYFVFDGHAIKIGYAKVNPEARIRDLQIGNPRKLTLLGTMPGTVLLEKTLHAHFARIRIRGEWFRHSKTILRFIDATNKYDAALLALYAPAGA